MFGDLSADGMCITCIFSILYFLHFVLRKSLLQASCLDKKQMPMKLKKNKVKVILEV